MALFSPPAVSARVSPTRRSHRAALPAVVLGGLFLLGMAGQAVRNEAERRKSAAREQAYSQHEAREAWESAARMAAKDKTATSAAFRAYVRSYRRTISGAKQAAPPLKARTEMLDRNRVSLDAFRAALNLPYCVAPDDDAARQSGTYRRVNYRAVLGLFQLDGDLQAGRGDFAAAADAYEDILQIGQTLPRGGGLMPLLESDSYQSMGRDPLWRIVGKLDAPSARRAARRLESLLETHQTAYADALNKEKQRGETEIDKLYQNSQKLAQQKQVVALINQRQGQRFGGAMFFHRLNRLQAKLPPAPPPTLWNQIARRWEKWEALREFDEQISPLCREADLPYQVRQKNNAARMAQVQAKTNQVRQKGQTAPPVSLLQSMTFSSSYLSGFGSPAMAQFAHEAWTEEQTQNRFLLVALALQAYQKEHANRVPSALSDLVPTYLKRLPLDPYAYPAAPFCWKLGAGGTLASSKLYSVGQDGTDDSGVRPPGSLRQGYSFYGFWGLSSGGVRPVGKGDILAPQITP